MNSSYGKGTNNPFIQGSLTIKLFLFKDGRIIPHPSVWHIGISIFFLVISYVTSSIKSTSPLTIVSISSTTIAFLISKSTHSSVAELHKAKYAKNLLILTPP